MWQRGVIRGETRRARRGCSRIRLGCTPGLAVRAHVATHQSRSCLCDPSYVRILSPSAVLAALLAAAAIDPLASGDAAGRGMGSTIGGRGSFHVVDLEL